MQPTSTIPVAAPPRMLLSLEEVARATGLSRAHLYRRIQDGSLKSVKSGRRRLVSIAALNEFCEHLEASA